MKPVIILSLAELLHNLFARSIDYGDLNRAAMLFVLDERRRYVLQTSDQELAQVFQLKVNPFFTPDDPKVIEQLVNVVKKVKEAILEAEKSGRIVWRYHSNGRIDIKSFSRLNCMLIRAGANPIPGSHLKSKQFLLHTLVLLINEKAGMRISEEKLEKKVTENRVRSIFSSNFYLRAEILRANMKVVDGKREYGVRVISE